MDRNPPPPAAIISPAAAAEPADPRPMAMSSSPGINNGHNSDDALDQGVQGLTAEEEMREIHSLSVKEIASVQADLIGLSNSICGLHISRSDSSASPVDQAQMMEIAKAMGSLPQSETEAYNKALQLCPDQVLDPCRMQMFLDYATEQEEPDGESKMGTYFRAVATQLAKYWKVREYIFNNANPNTAYLPMTQVGALTPAGAMQLANRKVFQPLAQVHHLFLSRSLELCRAYILRRIVVAVVSHRDRDGRSQPQEAWGGHDGGLPWLESETNMQGCLLWCNGPNRPCPSPSRPSIAVIRAPSSITFSFPW